MTIEKLYKEIKYIYNKAKESNAEDYIIYFNGKKNTYNIDYDILKNNKIINIYQDE